MQLAVVGMRCEDCAAQVRRALLRQQGVIHVDVQLPSASAVVGFDPERIGPRDLMEAVNGVTGVCPSMYRAIPVPVRPWKAAKEEVTSRRPPPPSRGG